MFDNSNEENDNFDDKSDGFIPEHALDALVDERSLHPEETNEQTARRLLKENAPIVAQSLLRLAIYSKSERTRLDAGKYVMDRVLGKIGDDLNTGSDSPIDGFLNEVTEFVKANAPGGNN